MHASASVPGHRSVHTTTLAPRTQRICVLEFILRDGDGILCHRDLWRWYFCWVIGIYPLVVMVSEWDVACASGVSLSGHQSRVAINADVVRLCVRKQGAFVVFGHSLGFLFLPFPTLFCFVFFCVY